MTTFMKTQKHLIRSCLPHLLGVCLFLLVAQPASGRVVDDFNDNTKTAWQDFTFVPGLGLPVETGGQFKFDLPPAGQALFVASTKTSETFELKEGRTLEFQVDLVSGNGKDAFAVLAWIPGDANKSSSLAGYGLAKSTTDILITKGIGKYFYSENPFEPIKNENVTLVLRLTAKGGNVIINGRVLDKDNNNAVLFEKTFIDTPAADPLSDGADSPAAPYLGSGHFTLYCYEDFDRSAPQDVYEVIYDNAEAYVLDSVLLDDFNDNTKTAWQDFTFVPGLGLPVETGGQFKFDLPPAGQALFVASTKTSRSFDLTEGERLELSVDLVSGNGKDAFAVLAWIPGDANKSSSLAGYGLAKSTTDILITKGIGKYFYNENPPEPIKNENVALSLVLTAKGGNVIINGRVLDKDNNNAVLFEKTFIDTPAADPLSDGADSPAAPYLGSGHFTLYCYEDFDRSAPQDVYEVIYDNAEVAAPPLAGNTPPIITDVKPDRGSLSLAATSRITFKVSDDKPLVDSQIKVVLNGRTFSTANGLTLTGSGNARDVSLGGLEVNKNYAASLQVTDSDAAPTSIETWFDTFLASNLVIEVEDYNFDGGQFRDNPVLLPEGNGPDSTTYNNQTGVLNVDYFDTRGSPNNNDTKYRTQDPVRMQHTLDIARQKFIAAGGGDAGVFDYDVGDIAAGEWLNYTHTFPAGSYEVYLRESVVNLSQSEVVLERVVGDPTQPDAATKVLGSFFGPTTGFVYRNVQLTDAAKNRVIVRLSGPATLRLRQGTSDAGGGAAFQNYLLFLPVTDAGVLRAAVSSVSPAPGAEVQTVTPTITATIENRDTSVKAGTIKLMVNGAQVSPVVVADANGASLTYAISPLPPSGAVNTASISFDDNENVSVPPTEWTFVISYKALNPANRVAGTGKDRGFTVRMVQAPADLGNQENNLQRAEDQLAAGSRIPAHVDTTVVEQVINMTQDERSSGFFAGEYLVPGLEAGDNGTDNFAVEITAYLDLSAGVHRFGVVSDDGYKIIAGANFKDLSAPTLAFRNGGSANETFDFVVAEAGLYPFRMIWYEAQGNAYAEWFSVNTASGDRTLLNDPDTATAIKAYTTVNAAAQGELESAALVNGPYAVDASATVNAATRTITLPAPSSSRFYRIKWPMLLGIKIHISSFKIEGANLVLGYEILPVIP
jgi:hypothetical protein